uniref:Uncharacterized protein n=1 Tax=Arundo donax TaxID=35708 RepID=A0A0A9B972_ARUDO
MASIFSVCAATTSSALMMNLSS